MFTVSVIKYKGICLCTTGCTGRLQSWMRAEVAGALCDTFRAGHQPFAMLIQPSHPAPTPHAKMCTKNTFPGVLLTGTERGDCRVCQLTWTCGCSAFTETAKREAGSTRGSSPTAEDMLHPCKAWERVYVGVHSQDRKPLET